LSDALAACQAGLAQDSTAAALHNLVATCYAAEARYAQAIESLQKAVHFQPDYVPAYINMGGMYAKLGQLAEAEEPLRKAVELRPDHPGVRRRMGELYLNTDRYEEAAAELQQALRIFPENATTQYLLAQALENLERVPEAIAALQRATRLDRGFSEAYYRLGVLSRRAGQKAVSDSAMAAFQRLQRIGGGDADVPKQLKKLRLAVMDTAEEPEPHYHLGVFFAQHGFADEALDQFSTAATLAQGNAYMLNQVGGAMLKLNRRDTALSLYQEAARQDSTYLPALINAGSVLTMLQRHPEALLYYQRAVAAAPQDPRSHYYMGLGLLSAGRQQEARQALAAVQRLVATDDPLYQQADAVLKRLPASGS
jgi:tetratricopeptide (TPR) repeat protein